MQYLREDDVGKRGNDHADQFGARGRQSAGQSVGNVADAACRCDDALARLLGHGPLVSQNARHRYFADMSEACHLRQRHALSASRQSHFVHWSGTVPCYRRVQTELSEVTVAVLPLTKSVCKRQAMLTRDRTDDTRR